MKVIIFCLLAALAVAKTFSFVDIKEQITNAACLKQSYARVCVRGFQSIGRVDPYLEKNLKALSNVSLTADVYMLPCVYCNDPEAQAEKIMAVLKVNAYNTLWVQVEGAWGADQATNQVFIQMLIKALQSKGVKKVGIFTFQPTWDRIFGKAFDALSSLPLWYTRWNGDPEAKDFVAFGGWKKPTAKQYDTDDDSCSVNINSDSYYE